MKAIYLTDDYNRKQGHIRKVYSKESIGQLQNFYEVDNQVYIKDQVINNLELTKDVEAIITTWGMPHFTVDEIKANFPALKYVFYGAGSVQSFAKEFLECGVRIFSSAAANALPVAEFTTAAIIIANKTGFNAIKRTNRLYYNQQIKAHKCLGNYKAKIGIVGVGKIGSMVAKNLSTVLDCELYGYDPFLSEERAKELNIKLVDLPTLFNTCDTITNHLADKKELTGILNYDLFKLMQDGATFINTGRGRQVDEKGLIKALKENKSRNALLDVTLPEPAKLFSPLRWMSNVYLTPHIAGSLGGELKRMGQYMVDDALALAKGEKTNYEVTLDMLATLA